MYEFGNRMGQNYTAKALVAWLQARTPSLIMPDDFSSKIPDLNVMDNALLGSRSTEEVQSVLHDITTIENLKFALIMHERI